MSDAQKLIEYQSKQFKNDIIQDVESTIIEEEISEQIQFAHDSNHNNQDSYFSIGKISSSSSMLQSEQSCHQQDFEEQENSRMTNDVPSQKQKPKVPKTKKIQKMFEERSSSDDEISQFSQGEEKRMHGKRQAKRLRSGFKAKAYPTKNFLPNFKGSHIQYLIKIFGEEYIKEFPVVLDIMNKNGISMKDYESIYNIPEFESAWKKFFGEKELYRDLFMSRSTVVSKKIHQKKIHVFEKAFIERRFTSIN